MLSHLIWSEATIATISIHSMLTILMFCYGLTSCRVTDYRGYGREWSATEYIIYYILCDNVIANCSSLIEYIQIEYNATADSLMHVKCKHVGIVDYIILHFFDEIGR